MKKFDWAATGIDFRFFNLPSVYILRIRLQPVFRLGIGKTKLFDKYYLLVGFIIINWWKDIHKG